MFLLLVILVIEYIQYSEEEPTPHNKRETNMYKDIYIIITYTIYLILSTDYPIFKAALYWWIPISNLQDFHYIILNAVTVVVHEKNYAKREEVYEKSSYICDRISV